MFTPAGQPIITSLLETDVYKFSMWQVLWRRHPTLDAHYRFVCRNTPAFALAELLPDVQTQLDALCALRFTAEELAWLAAQPALRAEIAARARHWAATAVAPETVGAAAAAVYRQAIGGRRS